MSKGLDMRRLPIRILVAAATVLAVVALCRLGRSVDAVQLNDTLRSVIQVDLPSVRQRLRTDRLSTIGDLLRWGASIVDLGGNVARFANLDKALPLMSAGQIYFDVWSPDDGGTSCDGFALFFQKVLGMFGVDAFTVDMGVPGTFLTHVTTVVPDGAAFYVFDPTFDGVYRSPDGALVDLASVLKHPGAAHFVAPTVPRTVIFPVSDVDKMEAFFAGLGLAPSCTIAPTGDYEICAAVPYNRAYLVAGWAKEMADNGIPASADLITTLLRRHIFRVSDTAGTKVRERFLTMVQDTAH